MKMPIDVWFDGEKDLCINYLLFIIAKNALGNNFVTKIPVDFFDVNYIDDKDQIWINFYNEVSDELKKYNLLISYTKENSHLMMVVTLGEVDKNNFLENTIHCLEL